MKVRNIKQGTRRAIDKMPRKWRKVAYRILRHSERLRCHPRGWMTLTNYAKWRAAGKHL